ncbi:adenylyltransferase/cytidyltransferase family protein [Candidatus Woesearchaeota archaeon]|nr:adenylyltransferase/cytidyltransferase family protein [Candidatus Woesearchaeota archaeon]
MKSTKKKSGEKNKTTIVYAYVCGDIIHEGHLLQLENGKALGDKLIVGVLTDEAVMEKKPRPIVSFRERLRLIQSLKCVDCAVPQENYSPLNNLIALQPDIHMESASHLGNKYLDDLKKVFKGRIVMTPYYPEQSSTAIKDKIKKHHKNNK